MDGAMQAGEAGGGRFRRILVPLDGSTPAECALPYAVAVGGPMAELTLIQVVPAPDTHWDLLGTVAAPEDDAIRRRREVARRQIGATAEALRAAGRCRAAELVVGIGDRAEEICRAAQERGVDLIVMASRGAGVRGRGGHGDVPDRVIRRTGLPVMVVPPGVSGCPGAVGVARPRRLVVPLDGSDRSAQAVPVAAALASATGLPIHLLSVIDPQRVVPPAFAYDIDVGGPLHAETIGGLQDDLATALRRRAAELTGAGLAATWEVRYGPTVPTIVGVAGPEDVIVMASHGQGRATRWLLGSVAEQLVHGGPVPVVVQRSVAPPDVVIPVADEPSAISR